MKKHIYEVTATIKANCTECNYVVDVDADNQKEAIQEAKAMWHKVSHLFHIKARQLKAHEEAFYAFWTEYKGTPETKSTAHVMELPRTAPETDAVTPGEPEADAATEAAAHDEPESNARTYKVSFIVDGIAQGNMAVAGSAEDVEAYYSGECGGRMESIVVREAAEWEIEEDRRRGMPFVKVPAVKPETPDTTQEAAPETEAADATEAVLKRGRDALDRAESLCYDGKLDPAFVGCMSKAYYRALTEYRCAAARANNPRLAAALDKAKAKRAKREADAPSETVSEAGQPAPQADTTDEEKLDALFNELVPVEGKADTVAGEIVRAVCRIGYRYNNDGDYVGCGYGKETCNPAARYLMANAGENVAEIVRCLWAAGEECGVLDDGSYEDWLSELVKATLVYLEANPELKTTPNAVDMWEYRDPEEDVDDEWDEEDEEDEEDEDADEWDAA